MSTKMTDDRTTTGATLGPSRDRWIVGLWSLVLSVVIFAPLLGSRGGVLRGDLLFVPHQPIKGAWLGFDGSAPHTAPYDFVISLVTTVVPGDLVQKALLLLVLFLAGTGAAAAVSRFGLPAQLVAATFFVWNPFVYERLAAGSLTLLFGYAALGWVVWAAARPAGASILGFGPMVLALALAGWTSPTGGLIAAVVALGALAHRGAKTLLITLGAALVVNLPWIIPGLIRPGGVLPDSTGVSAYAASPDTSLGVFGSVLTLGGIWDPAATAPGRGNAVLSSLALVLTILGIAGVVLAWGRSPRGPITGLTVVAVLGLLVALLGAYGSTRTAIDSIAENIPGGVLLRDGHAWLAPLALLLAIGWGSLARLAAERGSTVVIAAATVVGIAIPVALLPGMALALDGNLINQRYPNEWWKVRGILASEDRAGIAVAPVGGYRDFTWNDLGTVADPAPHFFLGDVVVDNSRTVNGVVVPADNERATALRAALDKPKSAVTNLLAMGIDTVVVERDVDGATLNLAGKDSKRIFNGQHLTVWSLTGDVASGNDDSAPAIPIIIADILALALVLGAAGMALGQASRRPRPAGGSADRPDDYRTSAFARPAPAVVPATYEDLPPPHMTPTSMASTSEPSTSEPATFMPPPVTEPPAETTQSFAIPDVTFEAPIGDETEPTMTYPPFDQPSETEYAEEPIVVSAPEGASDDDTVVVPAPEEAPDDDTPAGAAAEADPGRA